MPNSRGWSVGVWPQRRPPPPRQCVWCMHFCCHTHTHTHRAGPPLRPARSIHAGQIDILCLAICFLRRCQKLNVPRNLSGSMGSKESVDVVFFFFILFFVCVCRTLCSCRVECQGRIQIRLGETQWICGEEWGVTKSDNTSPPRAFIAPHLIIINPQSYIIRAVMKCVRGRLIFCSYSFIAKTLIGDRDKAFMRQPMNKHVSGNHCNMTPFANRRYLIVSADKRGMWPQQGPLSSYWITEGRMLVYLHLRWARFYVYA